MSKRILVATVAAMLAMPAQAQQTVSPTYVAKPGETINLGPVMWVSTTTCQSLAVAKTDFEILSGPPGLKVEVREAMVIPNSIGNCKNEVKGAYVWLTVPADIESSNAHIIARVTHHDRNGPQQRGMAFNLMIAH